MIRHKTTADFYEQIYGEMHRPFNQYFPDWGEAYEAMMMRKNLRIDIQLMELMLMMRI